MILQGFIILITLFLGTSAFAMSLWWDRLRFRKEVLFEANRTKPQYVIHSGIVLGQLLSIADIAIRYGLKPGQWVPARKSLPIVQWEKTYGSQAIHLYPLKPGEDYKIYLREVIHNGMGGLRFEGTLQKPKWKGTKVTLRGILPDNSNITKRTRYILDSDYFLPGTNIAIFDEYDNYLGDTYRVMDKAYAYPGGYRYVFNENLPLGTVYLRRLIDVQENFKD